MSASPNLKLPYLDANQNQKSVTHNAALRVLDALVNLHAASTMLTAPPGAPNDGQCWIVASGGTGAWLGKDLNVAAWQDGAWTFYAPNPGFVAYVDALGGALMWNGTAWVSLLGAITQLALGTLGIGTGADPANPFSAKLNAALFAAQPTTATPAGTGDVRLKLSKQAAGNTASLMFQDNYGARAEIGLAGDDNLHLRVSPDGSVFTDALVLTASGGAAAFAAPPTHPSPAPGDSSTASATTAWVAAKGYATASSAAAAAPVQSVAGRAGSVALAVADVAGAATLASPAFTGVPTAPNAPTGTNSAQLATTSFVAASFVTYGYAAANYATSASPTLTGTPSAPTQAAKDNSTRLATTGYADRAVGATLARSQVSDAAYGVLPTDRTVAVIALTAPRILTLPAASAFPQGATLTVVDESGACSATSPLTLAASGSDTLNGVASAVIASPYGYLALQSNASNKWTLVDGPSGAVSSLNGGPLAGLRNRLLNGSFALNQRGYASNTSLAAGAYGHDRWKAGANGCTYAFTPGTPDTGVTITAGSLLQVVETANVEGGVYTLSWSGSATARVTYTASGASSPTTTTAAVSPLMLAGVNAGLAVSVEFGTGTLGRTQLEPGPLATPLERRPIGVETALCQRYYQVSGGVIASMISGSPYLINAGYTFPVMMRTVPTPTIVNGTNVVDRPNVGTYSLTGLTASYSPPGVFAAGTGGVCVQFSTNGASAGLCEIFPGSVSFSAEL